MFLNTMGGKYQKSVDGLKTTYTFPEGAYFLIEAVKIPLGNMTVECYGDKFDERTIRYLAYSASLIVPQKSTTCNSSLFITDQHLLMRHYPSREHFEKNQIAYLDVEKFVSIQEQILVGDPSLEDSDVELYLKIKDFCQKWNETNIDHVHQYFKEVLTEDDSFPKDISIIFDDRKSKHTCHIILSFINPCQYTLRIDNTISPLLTFTDNKVLDRIKLRLDPDTCIEKVKSNTLKLTSGCNLSKNGMSLLLSDQIDNLMLEKVYSHMIESLQYLEFELCGVELNYTPYNQKKTNECVSFSIQNKLDYMNQSGQISEESATELGIRLRAEQVVLLYLLTGSETILRFNEKDATERDVHYEPENWYPNFSEVCFKLRESINNLPFQDLKRLYSYFDNPNVNKLARTFKEEITRSIRKHTKSEIPEYATNPCLHFKVPKNTGNAPQLTTINNLNEVNNKHPLSQF